jgi:hypothetical protein
MTPDKFKAFLHSLPLPLDRLNVTEEGDRVTIGGVGWEVTSSRRGWIAKLERLRGRKTPLTVEQFIRFLEQKEKTMKRREDFDFFNVALTDFAKADEWVRDVDARLDATLQPHRKAAGVASTGDDLSNEARSLMLGLAADAKQLLAALVAERTEARKARHEAEQKLRTAELEADKRIRQAALQELRERYRRIGRQLAALAPEVEAADRFHAECEALHLTGPEFFPHLPGYLPRSDRLTGFLEGAVKLGHLSADEAAAPLK